MSGEIRMEDVMRYRNPVIKGFYPDPSICRANGRYYLACSSFQYFPSVPLFESRDLVNWTQIGHVLTKKSQVKLEGVRSSGGVFAPTLRCCGGRFYMTANNNSTCENFYVYTDDIYGEWSEPILVEMDGIDPSFYFEDGRAYYMTNGHDEDGNAGIVQCEIDIHTGKKLSKTKVVWKGSGGRYLESPHLYKINGCYYVMAAEGGTEYGHMVTYARGESVWGPFESYRRNPVLTNRDKAPYVIQGIGHGDLICDDLGEWHMVCLGFRQIDEWQQYHHLGREVFLVPVVFGEDGWFLAGKDGTADEVYEIKGKGDAPRQTGKRYTFANTQWKVDWCHIRCPHMEDYQFAPDKLTLFGTNVTLDAIDSPTFIGIRQRDFDMELACRVSIKETGAGNISPANGAEAGVTMYMAEDSHYDLAIRKSGDSYEALLRINIGGMKHIEHIIKLFDGTIKLRVYADRLKYRFCVETEQGEITLGTGLTKYLSSEVAGGFTGVVIGLYAVGRQKTEFSEFYVEYP